jgi:hypothetical protein
VQWRVTSSFGVSRVHIRPRSDQPRHHIHIVAAQVEIENKIEAKLKPN